MPAYSRLCIDTFALKVHLGSKVFGLHAREGRGKVGQGACLSTDGRDISPLSVAMPLYADVVFTILEIVSYHCKS